MGDNEGHIISTEEAMLAGLIVVNDEFQKMICKECELTVESGMVRKHLSKRHGVKSDMATRIANMIDMGECGCVAGGGKKPKKPENGTRPQEWLMVFDMLQCKGCGEFHARSVDEVQSHWHRAGHEKAEGGMVKAVRMQSWGGWGGRAGKDKEFWVVDEQLGFGVKEDRKVGNCGGDGEVEGVQQREDDDTEWEVIRQG